jgi:hypothetical protein
MEEKARLRKKRKKILMPAGGVGRALGGEYTYFIPSSTCKISVISGNDIKWYAKSEWNIQRAEDQGISCLLNGSGGRKALWSTALTGFSLLL